MERGGRGYGQQRQVHQEALTEVVEEGRELRRVSAQQRLRQPASLQKEQFLVCGCLCVCLILFLFLYFLLILFLFHFLLILFLLLFLLLILNSPRLLSTPHTPRGGQLLRHVGDGGKERQQEVQVLHEARLQPRH